MIQEIIPVIMLLELVMLLVGQGTFNYGTGSCYLGA